MADRSESSTYDNILNPSSSTGNVYVHDVAVGSNIITAQPGATVNVNSHGHVEKGSTETVDLVDIQKKLKEWYKDLQLPVVSWMRGANLPLEKYYIPLQLNAKRLTRATEEQSDYNPTTTTTIEQQTDGECEIAAMFRRLCIRILKLSLINAGEKLELEKIFVSSQNVNPKRILIESQPGFGKTTLAHKIISDWVADKNYAEHFDYALLISLKYLKGRTIRDIVMERAGVRGNDEETWRALNSDKTLLVLDGLDEVSDSDKENVLKVLYDTFDNKMVVITTCRTGIFQLEDEYKGSLFGGAAKSEEFWDRKVTILGLIGKNRKKFVENFVGEENKDQIMAEIKKTIQPVEEIFQSPLLLILLVFVTRENAKYKIRNRTDLFKNLVDCIIRRSKTRLSKKFTLFDGKSNENKDYHDLFCKFGEVSLDHILNNDLQFECDDFTDSIYDMGFLLKHETKLKLETITHYEGFHLTILEFAAAFSLKDEFTKNDNKFPSDKLNKINDLRLKKGSTSMVIPFLCGLMGDKNVEFFRQFSEFSALYSIEQGIIDSVVSECEFSEELCSVIAEFIPPVYCYNNNQPLITMNDNLCRSIVSLNLTSSELWDVNQCKRLNIKSLAVFVNDQVEIDNYQYQNNTKCENLFVYVNNSITSYHKMAAHLKLLFECVSRTYTNVYIRHDVPMNLINECVNDGIFKDQTLDYLRFDLTNDQIATETIVKIITNNTVKQLTLEIEKNYDVNNIDSIIPTIVSSDSINSILIRNFTNQELKLDLCTVVQNKNKQWQFFGVTNIFVTSSLPTPHKISCKSFQIYGTVANFDVGTVHSVSTTQFQSNYDVYHLILTEPNLSSWVGFETIVDLTLAIGEHTSPLETLSHLSKFKNLKKLKLCIINGRGADQQPEIVQCLQSVTVNQLQIRWEHTISLAVLNIVDGVRNSIETNQLHSIKNIDFEVVDINDSVGIARHLTALVLEKLKSVLECDTKVTVHLVYQFSKFIDKSLLPVFRTFNPSQFKIDQGIEKIPSPCTIQEFTCDFYLPLLRILKIQKKSM